MNLKTEVVVWNNAAEIKPPPDRLVLIQKHTTFGGNMEFAVWTGDCWRLVHDNYQLPEYSILAWTFPPVGIEHGGH